MSTQTKPSIEDYITNSVNKAGDTFVPITNVSYSTTNFITTATITTARETIVKNLDFITLSQPSYNGVLTWVVGQ